MDKQTISLANEERAILERAGGDSYHVRHYRNNQDLGLYQQNGRTVTLNAEQPLLTVTGEGGKRAIVEIPGNTSLDPSDFIPRIEMDTKQPTAVIGGTFIADKESSQMAVIPVFPSAFIGKDGEELLTENGGKDQRIELNMRLLQYTDLEGKRHTVMVPPGAKGVEFFDPSNQETLLRFSGRETFDQNRKALDRAKTRLEVQDQENRLTPAGQGRMSKANVESVLARKNAAKEAATSIGNLKKGLLDFNNRPLYARADFKKEFDAAEQAAKRMVGSNGMPNEDEVKKFHGAMDTLIEKANRLPNKGLGLMAKDKFTGIKDKVDKVDGLQASLDHPQKDMAALASAAQVDSALTGQPRVHVPDETNVSPNIGRGDPGQGRTLH